MGKTFKNFRRDLRDDYTEQYRPRTATRLEKAIEKYKKSIYTMQADLDYDFDEEVLDNESNNIQRLYKE